MKKCFSTPLMMTALTILISQAIAGTTQAGLKSHILKCRGINPDSHRLVQVEIDSNKKTINVDGVIETVQILPGPDEGTIAVVSPNVFVGVSTKGYKKATINSATLDQVNLTCDGTSI